MERQAITIARNSVKEIAEAVQLSTANALKQARELDALAKDQPEHEAEVTRAMGRGYLDYAWEKRASDQKAELTLCKA